MPRPPGGRLALALRPGDHGAVTRARRGVVPAVVTAMAALAWAALPAAGSAPAPAAPPVVSALHLSGSFDPQDVVTEGGAAWLLGISGPAATSCAVERVGATGGPGPLHPLPSCGLSMVPGPAGDLYVAAFAGVRGTNDYQVRTEVFDPATGSVHVRSPVDLTLVGSSIAHTALAYGDGSLWLYGLPAGATGPALVRITPATGAVAAVWHHLAAIGGHFPLLVAGRSGVWAAPGVGGAAVVLHLAAGRGGRPVAVLRGARGVPASVLWLAGAGASVWADLASYRAARPGGLSPERTTTRLVAFGPAGRRTLETGPETTPDLAPVMAGGRLWSVGVGARCAGPQRLMEIDPATGRTTVRDTLATPVEACLDEGGAAQVAAAGRRLFVLDAGGTPAGGGILYRIEV